jgi:F0F1-type ATP synthase membrane subunit c/vacuolar-type H+-ATPase subunit K
VLRGGAWIGVLERLSLFGTLLAAFPMGLVAIVAVKAFARYPELKTAQATGAIERFIIGTFASLGWAAVCVGLVEVVVRGSP